MIERIEVAPGLEISWTPGCPDIWLTASAGPAHAIGAISLDKLSGALHAPTVSRAFREWAYKTVLDQAPQRGIKQDQLPSNPN